MIPSCCFVLAVVLGAAGVAAALSPPPVTRPAKPTADPFAGDERAARLAARYKAMLEADPVAGVALDRLWKAYEEAGATAALIDECRANTENAPGSPAWLLYGHVLEKAGRTDEAATAYERAGTLDPQSFLAPVARADLALSQRHPADAAPLLEVALARLPPGDRRRADLLEKLGSSWLAAGDPEKAAGAWEQLAAAAPAGLAVHRRLAEVYLRNYLGDRALVHLEYLDAHGDAPTRAPALREIGRLRENRGEFDAARDAFESGLALTSRDNWLHGELLDALIRLYARAGRTAELADRWRRALDAAPRDLGSLLQLERLAETQGDAPGRLAWLDRITTLAPGDRDSRRKLARLLAENGQRDRAAAAYDVLLQDQPEPLDLVLARADIDLQSGRVDAAIARIEARLAKSPADEDAAAAALEFFLSRHLDEPAERCLRSATARQPASVEPAIALAKFLVARRRSDEARELLDRLIREPAEAAASAARCERVAETFKEADMSEDALRTLGQAAALAPADPGPLTTAAELRVARGEPRQAADSLQKAIELLPDGTAREEIEHRLFQVLAGEDQAVGTALPPTAVAVEPGGRLPSEMRPGVLPPAAPTARAVPEASNASDALTRYLDNLGAAAAAKPDPGAYLRLARWQAWAHRTDAATASAEKAIELDPANLPARLFLIRLAIDLRQTEVAAAHLKSLIALDPAHASAYERQLGGVQMDAGDFEDALHTYARLQAAAPGAFEPLTDLALAQQRAERWFDALETWKRADALPSLSLAQRGDVRRSLVAVYEHVGEYTRAAELLEAAVNAEVDLVHKQERFDALRELCAKHALVEWLTARWESRLHTAPDDYFTMTAVAALWHSQGRDDEADRLSRRAVYSATDPASARRALSEEAEARGDLEEAIADRRQLLGLPGQSTSEALAKLAALEESVEDNAAAGRTWEQIAARFPRDPVSLTLAAEFFERAGRGDRAVVLRRAVFAIDPADLSRLFKLAEAERHEGDVAAATRDLEAVLARSQPESAGEPLHLPPELQATGRRPFVAPAGPSIAGATPVPAAGEVPGMGSATGEVSGTDDRSLRLASIRELAALLTAQAAGSEASAARERWQARWKAEVARGQRSEPLLAFVAGGDTGAAMDVMESWFSEQPNDADRREAFLRAGLQMGDAARLGRWAWGGRTEESAARGPQLVEALLEFLSAGGKPAALPVAELFPPEVRARDLLWRVAKEGFADHRWYAPAAELGQRVISLASTGRAAYALDLTFWELILDHPDQARAVLRKTVDESGGVVLGGSEGGTVFEALRAYYLLLPAGERGAFVESYLDAWRSRGEPVRGVLAAMVLRGVSGDETAAEQAADVLVSLQLTGPANRAATPAALRYGYLLDAGAQLQTWGLPALARHLWRRALDVRSSFDRADPDAQRILGEIADRLLVADVASATNPQAAHDRVVGYLADHPPTEHLRAAAAQLLARAQYPAAQQLYHALVQQMPEDGDAWRNLLAACKAGGDLDTMEARLHSLLDAPRDSALALVLGRPDLLRSLAALLELEGDAAGSVRTLEHEIQAGVVAPAIVAPLAHYYAQAGKIDDTRRVWQAGIDGDPAEAATYRLALARLEAARGALPAAVTLLEAAAAGPESPNRAQTVAELAKLYFKLDRPDAARELMLRAFHSNDCEAVEAMMPDFVAAGQQTFVQDGLRSAIWRTRDPQTRFDLQQQVVRNQPVAPDGPSAGFLREMRRLRTFALAAPSLAGAYRIARYSLARQHGAERWLEEKLEREWRGGAGAFVAGEDLVTLYSDRREAEALTRVIHAIDARPNLPETSLANIADLLIAAGFPDSALPISERLYRRFPQNDAYTLRFARALYRGGQVADADRLLESLDREWVFRDDPATKIGALYEELGEPERAQDFYTRATLRDGDGSRSGEACSRLAGLADDRKDWREARRRFQEALRQPAAAVNLTPLVDDWQRSGRLERETAGGLPGGAFPLTFVKRAQLLSLMCRRLRDAGRLPEAQAMVAARPEFLAGSPALSAEWRRDLRPEQLPAAASALERAAAFFGSRSARLGRDLASVDVRWADADANDEHAVPAERMARLLRAHECAPDDFEAARRLAAFQLSIGRTELARGTLGAFLQERSVPAERAIARELIGQR